MSDWTADAAPRLSRFAGATMGAPDLAAFEADWAKTGQSIL